MTQATSNFTNISPDEVAGLSFDFTTQIPAGDSIGSVSGWNCTVSPTSLVADPTPAARLRGAPSLVGNVVVQSVGGCIAGVIYVMEAVVITAGGNTLSLWTYLACKPVGSP